jgi:carbon storage regulator
MLVLSRKLGQELVIGDSVRIVVNRISGNRVTLGIVAPDNVRVLRGELEVIAQAFDQAEDPPPRIPLADSLTLGGERDPAGAGPFAPASTPSAR